MGAFVLEGLFQGLDGFQEVNEICIGGLSGDSKNSQCVQPLI